MFDWLESLMEEMEREEPEWEEGTASAPYLPPAMPSFLPVCGPAVPAAEGSFLRKREAEPARIPEQGGGAPGGRTLPAELLRREAGGGQSIFPYPAPAARGAVPEQVYRRLVQAAAPTEVRPVSGGVILQEQSPAPRGLSVGELDRAVCRDSRRYDGAMSIY